MIHSFLCISHIPVGHAGGTTPRTGEVELRREQQSRAMQEQLPRHEEHEEKHKLRVLRVFVVNKKIGDAGYILRGI
jgi:hypothetical protein